MAALAQAPALEEARVSVLEEVAASPASRPRIDGRAAWIWILSGGLVLYLGINGGGYDLVVRNQAGVVTWWIVLLGALFGVLPASRLSRAGWVAAGLFGAFLVWSAIAATWSLSSERSLQEVSRLACYVGVLFLALTTYGDRRRALRHAVGAVASALMVIIALALLSRLRPGTFPSGQTASFLPGSNGRLNWPLDYWNGLAALVALAIPLLLAIATSARRIAVQAVAAAAIPMAALCGYLTFSRGGALATGVAVAVFITLAPRRIPKLATLLVSGAASAALIAGAVHRSAMEHGLTTPAAHHQGTATLVALILACAAAALAQVAVALTARSPRARRLLTVSPPRARVLLVVGLAAAVFVLLALHAPGRLSHAWNDFKGPNAAGGNATLVSRYGTLSGEGRYQFWKTAVDALPGHWIGGWGPGTFQLLWLPRAPFWSYVINAHSLYVETLAEVGLVGLALLVGFFLTLLGTALHRVVMGSGFEARTQVAAVAAATCAFLVSAAVDWVWQLPVLPVAVLLIVAAVLAPERSAVLARERAARERGACAAVRRGWARWTLRAAIAAAALACLVAIGVPLAETSAVRQSQAAVNSGNDQAALADTQSAAGIEPHAASPELQVALVLELQHKFSRAVTYARAATADEPANWQTWLVRSRLEAEAGHAGAAVAAYRRARALNPRSPIFKS